MSGYVVDASVVVKWYFDEFHTSAARDLLHRNDDLVAPDLLIPEVANAFLKKVRRDEMRRELADEALGRISGRVRLQPSRALAPIAMNIALRFQRSIDDAPYLALAREQDCALITADERLFNAMRGSFEDSLLWIEDVPGRPR